MFRKEPYAALFRLLLGYERTVSLVERPKCLLARNGRDHVVEVPFALRVFGFLDFEEIEVAQNAAVDADFSVLRSEIIDGKLAHFGCDLVGVARADGLHRL